jgi:hypothetical protein
MEMVKMNGRNEEMMKLVHKNLESVIRHRASNCPGGDLVEGDGYIMYTIGEESFDAHLNGLMLTSRLEPDRVEPVFLEAVEYFGKRNMGFTVWIREGEDEPIEIYLKESGRRPKRHPGSAVMYVDRPFGENVQSVRISGTDSPVSVKRVRMAPEEAITADDMETMNDYMDIVGESFDKSRLVSEIIVESAVCGGIDTGENGVGSMDSRESATISVAYMGKKAVGGAITYVRDGIGGIYWVGVKSSHRRLGLGSLVTMIAADEAFSNGADMVILQASLAGEVVYGRLGFRTVSRYRSYDIG